MINQDTVKKVFTSLFQSINEKKKALFLDIIGKQGGFEIKTINDFQHNLITPYNDFLEGLIRVEIADSDDLVFFMNNYFFLECHFGRVVQDTEGIPCYADKTSTILKGIFDFLKKGQKIEFNYNQEYTFHLPKEVFKTHEQVMSFFDALHYLYYGNSKRYIEFLHSLMKKETNPQTT